MVQPRENDGYSAMIDEPQKEENKNLTLRSVGVR